MNEFDYLLTAIMGIVFLFTFFRVKKLLIFKEMLQIDDVFELHVVLSMFFVSGCFLLVVGLYYGFFR